MSHSIIFEVKCPHCRWSEFWGLEYALRELIQIGYYRARAEFDPEMIRELFLIHCRLIECPRCEQPGLSARIAPKENWSWTDEIRCESCGKVIPESRWQSIPNAKYCLHCQQAMETGNLDKASMKFCPRCGSVMTLKPVSTNGMTRYDWSCTNIPPCRMTLK